ncbi:dTMP kinase [Bacillus clarus]|nr:hypothetical protein [Bacillus clarus]KFN04224.1 thymidylate kinase family protein [Bacillus clarus]
MIIAFEGIHGCGKSTQINLLEQYLVNEKKLQMIKTDWNSYPKLFEISRELKYTNALTPLSHTLIHSLDFLLRYEQQILPAEKENKIILVDRYIFTSYVRDGLRGISDDLLDTLYAEIIQPSLVFYFDIDPSLTLERVTDLKIRNPYVIGKDMNYSGKTKISEIFLQYQEDQRLKYKQTFDRLSVKPVIIDSTLDVNSIFNKIKNAIEEELYINSSNKTVSKIL